jgi:DNA-directed RNA polymerase specialized sigma24 family protein
VADRLSADIVERALSGDAASLQRLVGAHQDDMLNLAFRLTGDGAASWEIVRDVFLRLLEHPASVAGREHIIEEPLLHGVWALAREAGTRTDELPAEAADRAVAAVAAASMQLPERSRCALALGDLLGLPAAGIGAILGITAPQAVELQTRARLGLAEALGVRGRDQALVENEASRLYRLWPPEQGEPMAPEVVAEAERRGLIDRSFGEGPVIAGIRITPAVGIALLLVPLLIAAAIAVAVRSGGGDGGGAAVPTPVEGVTEGLTDGRFTSPLPTTTAAISVVSPEDAVTDPDGDRSGGSGGGSGDGSGGGSGGGDGSGGGSGGSGGGDGSEPAPAPTTQPAPEPAPRPTPTRTGGAQPPPPTTTAQAPAPAPPPTTTGGAQLPRPDEVPLP